MAITDGKVLVDYRPTAELARYIRLGIDTGDGRGTYEVDPEVARELVANSILSALFLGIGSLYIEWATFDSQVQTHRKARLR